MNDDDVDDVWKSARAQSLIPFCMFSVHFLERVFLFAFSILIKWLKYRETGRTDRIEFAVPILNSRL